MELAELMAKLNTRLSVSWSPRDVNLEADDLSNGKFDGFDPKLRVPFDVKTVKWEILPQLLQGGGRPVTKNWPRFARHSPRVMPLRSNRRKNRSG